MKHRRVCVDWVDAHTSGGWHDEDNLKLPPEACQALGYVIEDTDEYITLAQCVSKNDGKLNILAIPKGMITSMSEIE